jgi:flagellar hook protein FlgE
VDANYNLVDASTGYKVQRIGSQGVAEGFQNPTTNDLRIPYNVALPAQATTSVTFTGNLSSDQSVSGASADSSANAIPTVNVLSSGEPFLLNSGAVASENTLLTSIQGSAVAAGDRIQISGTKRDGSYVGGRADGVTYVVSGSDTLGSLLTKISQLYGGSGAELNTADGDTQVAGASADYVTSTSADASITITYDGVTRTLDKSTVTNTDLKAALTSAGSAGLDDLVAAINDAFNGATGTSGTVLNNIASVGASPTDPAQQVLQFENSAVGDAGNLAVSATGIGYANGVAALDTASLTSRGTALHVDGSQGDASGSTASVSNGNILLTDNTAGYSQTMMNLSYQKSASNPSGSFPLPSYFEVLTAGGEASRNVNFQVFDSQGISHTVAGTFVRRDTGNVWDLVIGSVTGNTQLADRRVNGIKFLNDGRYGGLTPVAGPDGSLQTDTSDIKLVYANDPTNVNTISMNLGTIGGLDGLSQFGGGSTAGESSQDGYAPGWLSSLSVNTEGLVEGVFTNGARRDIAAIKIATFQNAAGLQSVGNNYFQTSTNSGDPIETKAQSGGAGTIRGGSLEKSNVNTATEFVNLIEAQNGYQANARTIKIANEMLTELTNLIQ